MATKGWAIEERKTSHKVTKVGSGVPTQQGQENAGKFMVKRWFLRDKDLAEARSVMFQFTVPASEVPYGLELQPVEDEDYAKKRDVDVKNILDKDKDISKEEIDKKTVEQREGIKDTGVQIGHLQKCQGGFVFYQKLLSLRYKIVDAHWEFRLTEGQKQKGKGQPKNRIVEIVMSKNGQAIDLEDKTMNGIKWLLRQTFDHGNLWDNTKVPGRDNYVFNFQRLKKDENAQRIIDLQLTQPEQEQGLNPLSA